MLEGWEYLLDPLAEGNSHRQQPGAAGAFGGIAGSCGKLRARCRGSLRPGRGRDASKEEPEKPSCPEGWDGWQRPLSFPRQRGLAPGSQRAPGRSSSSRKSSLRAEDTLESIQELGSLELMGRDLGLAHYGPLRKSISADSLNSISSIGNNFGQDFTVGQVEVSMEYDGRAAALHVTLLQGKDLLEKEDARFESCFMRVSLLPAEQIVGISRVSPSFPP